MNITKKHVENFLIFRQIYSCFLLKKHVFLIEQSNDHCFRGTTKSFPHHGVVNPQSAGNRLAYYLINVSPIFS